MTSSTQMFSFLESKRSRLWQPSKLKSLKCFFSSFFTFFSFFSAFCRWCSTQRREARSCLSAATRRRCLEKWRRSGSSLCPVSQSTTRTPLCREDRRSSALVRSAPDDPDVLSLKQHQGQGFVWRVSVQVEGSRFQVANSPSCHMNHSSSEPGCSSELKEKLHYAWGSVFTASFSLPPCVRCRQLLRGRVRELLLGAGGQRWRRSGTGESTCGSVGGCWVHP